MHKQGSKLLMENKITAAINAKHAYKARLQNTQTKHAYKTRLHTTLAKHP